MGMVYVAKYVSKCGSTSSIKVKIVYDFHCISSYVHTFLPYQTLDRHRILVCMCWIHIHSWTVCDLPDVQ